MTLAIFGGTFNPVHMGHLQLAEEVRLRYSVRIVLFVPAFVPAHKAVEGSVPPAERLRMLRLALRGVPGFAADDCELRRGGVSYSIDTIRDVVRRHRLGDKPGLVIGDDLLEGFPAWKDAAAVAAEADLIVARRLFASTPPFAYPHRSLDNLVFPVSSRDIRRRLSEGAAVRGLLPPAVLSHIRKRRLYGCAG